MPNDHLLLSPPAISLLPILVLHLAIFVYLLRVKEKSAATWWLNGWLGGAMLSAASLFAGGSVYSPLGGYLTLGAIVFSFISIIPSLQFAYHFPRLTFAREARLVLMISALLVAGGVGWLAAELAAYPVGFLYSFEQFTYNPVRADTGLFIFSLPVFDVVYAFSLVWLWAIWLRKTVYLSWLNTPPLPDARSKPGWWRQIFKALWLPQRQEAGTTRAFALLMLFAPAMYLTSILELWTPLLAGSFIVFYLLLLSALMLIYLNNNSAPTSFMVKLVGVSLVTILAILGLAIPPIFTGYDEAYDAVRRSELPYIVSLVENAETAGLPAEVKYVVARPAPTQAMPFPVTYRLLFSRELDFEVEALAEEDARLLAELAANRWPWANSPWLNPEQALLNAAGNLERLLLPEGRRAYRGAYAGPEAHYLRYTIRSDDGQTLYEVGYSYLDYRRMLHQKTTPLLYLVSGVTLLLLLLFPYFFRLSLVRPLQNLLTGVTRVNRGDLAITVPVTAPDEFGYLTRSFNDMVQSLQNLHSGLQAEIGERKRAEAEVRALNATLEQRIAYRTRELAALYEVAAAAGQSLNQETLLADSLARTLAAIPADAGAIYLLAEAAGRVQPAARQGDSPAVLDQLDFLAAHQTLSSRVIRQAEPLFIPNVAVDPSLSQARLDPLSLLIAPLRAGGEVVGLFGLARQLGQAFTLDEVTLLATIAGQVGVAVQSHHLRRQATLHEERERIARDLHDSVTQSLYGLLMLVENGQAQPEAANSNTIAHTFTRMGETARLALKEMRLLIHQLHPPILAEVGLVGALHQRLSAVEGRASMQARLLADEDLALPEPVERAFYWIAQEALNNSLKHARGATSVRVYLRRAGREVIMEIVDNGAGFSPAAVSRGLGLAGMQERAAQAGGLLEVISAPGQGTTIRVSVEV